MSIEVYREYLTALEKTKLDGKYMPYNWGGLPKSLSFDWMPYGLMFGEFSLEIANSINQLTNYTRRLKAWSAVVTSMGDGEKLDVTQEFIDPLATIALTLPYVIRSRFIFAVGHP